MGAHFILLGLLCVSVLSYGKGCNQQLRENWDFPGSDIKFLYSPDVHHCQYLCTQHSSCVFFAFIGPESSVDNRHFYCFLKSTPSGKPRVQGPKQGVTSGYSLTSCNPDPKPCLPEVYHHVNFPGADYRSFFTADYEECQRACTNDPACQFFTFTNGDFHGKSYRFKCHLKFSWSVPYIPTVVANAGVISGFSHRLLTPECSTTVCQGKLFPNIDYPWHDIKVLAATSPEHCQSLCSAHPLCTYFSYISKLFRCYLKRNEHRTNGKVVAGITSGLPARFCQLDNKWVQKPLVGIDVPYSDIRRFVTGNAEACQRTCTEDPNCQFYAYVTKPRLCYLKRVITMPSPPKVTKLANVVSGFSMRNCRDKTHS